MSHQAIINENLLKGLGQLCINEWPNLCDISIQCDDEKEVPAHRLLLAISSEYFGALFRQEPESAKVTLPFSSDLVSVLVKSMVKFDEKLLKSANLVDVLRAADYLQMKSLVEIVSEMISRDINKDNFKEIVELIQVIHVPIIEKATGIFLKKNIRDPQMPAEISNYSTSMILKIMSSPLPKLYDEFARLHDVIETMEIIVDVVHKALQLSNRTKDWVNLSEDVRKDHRIWTQVIFQRGITKPKRPYDYDILQGKSVHWTGGFGTHPGESVSRTDGRFSIHGVIRKIHIKTRLWDNRLCVQGIQVFLKDGTNHAFGMKENDMRDVTVLEVPKGQHIKNILLRSGWYIDKLGFMTDQKIRLGPIGGPGGAQRDILYGLQLASEDLSDFYYIDGISGKVVQTQNAPAICDLSFKIVVIKYSDIFVNEI